MEWRRQPRRAEPAMPEGSPMSAQEALRQLALRHPDLALRTNELDLFQTDIYYVAEHRPVAVIAPRTAQDVAALTRSARELGLALSVRGAGLSYSAGYIPADDRTLILDMTGMNRIVELSAVDRYVTVEPGVTWAQLHEALAAHKLTTPFWGTFSGLHATVGGTVAQGGKFFGSGSRGGSAESVLALEVVTGAGDIIVTGSAAGTIAPSPFFRNYGPDLTGLFLGDCGAFGVKTQITLQLIPAPAALGVCSFSFDDPAAQLGAMAQIGSELLASECLGTDPFTARSRMASEGLGRDLATLLDVVKGSGSLVSGLRDAASIALHGRRFADHVGYLMNCVTEGRDGAEANSKLRRVRAIATQAGGRAVPASIPKVLRALPFPRMNGLLTPSAKRMNWLHTVVPNSRGGDCFLRTEDVFARHAATMKEHGIDRGYLLSTHGPTGVGVETLIRWSDSAYPIHTHFLTDEERARLRRRAGNPQAAAAVKALSKDIVAAWAQFGGAHLQIGRKYPYLATRQPATAALLGDLKRRFDPDNVLGPGNLFSPLT
ncbi:MAG: FAD-binding oxidoreductase [Methylobacteriaceae bacterium]|nr:FAD-binding oxidoreductase [Methylobacteriaceae bacterium]